MHPKHPARLLALAALAGTGLAAPAAAQAAPSVTFKTPTEGAVVSGTLANDKCALTIAGTSGRATVKLFVDGNQFDTEGAAPYNCSLDTKTLTDGTHKLRADLVDANGAKATTTRTITVRNKTAPAPAPAPANAAPQVAFKAPTEGQTVSGTLSGTKFEATATDDKKVTKVDFAVDGTALNSDTAAPYNGSFDSTKVANGKHTLTATAYDEAGLKTTATRGITVSNTVAPAPAPTPTPAPTPAPGTPATSGALWTMNLDAQPLGTLNGSVWGAQNKFKPERISVAMDPQGVNGKVMRTETRAGEFIGGDANGSRLRAEAYMPLVGGKQWMAHPGDEFYYGFRFMEGASNGTGHSITQLKGMNPDSNAYGGFIRVTKENGFRVNFGSAHIWAPQLGGIEGIRGKWYDFVIRVKYGTGTNGLVELWFGPAGKPVKQNLVNGSGASVGTTYRGSTVFGDNAAANTGGVLSKDIWIKQGIYGGGAVATAYYDQTRIGKSLGEVVPR
jgi:hypothetical protein